MTAEHQILERKDQRLEPQNKRMDQRKRIHDVKNQATKESGVFVGDDVVIARISVSDAAAAGRHVIDSAFKHRLKRHQERAWTGDLLHIDQLLAAAELAGGDEILHAGHHHGDDAERLGDAGDLPHHSDLHDLRFDLVEAGLQSTLARTVGNQNTGRTHQRVDDVADPQGELLDPPVHPGTDRRLVQFDLGLRQGGLGARLLRRDKA